MNGDELGAVGKSGFNLNIVDHLGDAFHHLGPRHDTGPGLHQIGNAAPIPRPLHDKIRDQGENAPRGCRFKIPKPRLHNENR